MSEVTLLGSVRSIETLLGDRQCQKQGNTPGGIVSQWQTPSSTTGGIDKRQSRATPLQGWSFSVRPVATLLDLERYTVDV